MSLLRVIDFETCGIEPPAAVIEAAICDVKDQERVGDPFVCLFGADRIPPETRAIHHIAPDEIRGMPRFNPQHIVDHAKADGVTALVAHHADFEGKWLGPVLGGLPMICTYKAALRLFPDAPGHSNQCLRYWLQDTGRATTLDDAKATPAHRAGPDAYATAHLLRALLVLATVADLIQWTKEPKLLPTIPIGKQRGAKWADVEEGFLRWMLRTADMDPDLKWNAQRELDRRQ